MSERDRWCTPQWLTELLPRVSLDPCSNDRSTVRSIDHRKEDSFFDGLETSWADRSVYVNPPYSNILPWAKKAKEAESFIFLVNLDPSTRWWRALVESGGTYIFLFDKRIAFEPPPGVKASTNPRPQALVCNWSGALMLDDRLNHLGQWWNLGGVLGVVTTNMDTVVDLS